MDNETACPALNTIYTETPWILGSQRQTRFLVTWEGSIFGRLSKQRNELIQAGSTLRHFLSLDLEGASEASKSWRTLVM